MQHYNCAILPIQYPHYNANPSPLPRRMNCGNFNPKSPTMMCGSRTWCEASLMVIQMCHRRWGLDANFTKSKVIWPWSVGKLWSQYNTWLRSCDLVSLRRHCAHDYDHVTTSMVTEHVTLFLGHVTCMRIWALSQRMRALVQALRFNIEAGYRLLDQTPVATW